jgi:CRISPR-associated endonuclease/helicase Cas3
MAAQMSLYETFAEGTGFSPFAWQERLYAQFLRGRMPGRLDLPTGLDRTSVLATWKIARESGAEFLRRLVYIVDRRTVVDQVSEEAAKLSRVCRELSVRAFRGQMERRKDLGWLVDPSCEALIIGTLDRVGSLIVLDQVEVRQRDNKVDSAGRELS